MDRPTSGGSYRRDPATGKLTRAEEAIAPAIVDAPAADTTTTEAGAPAEADTKRKSK